MLGAKLYFDAGRSFLLDLFPDNFRPPNSNKLFELDAPLRN